MKEHELIEAARKILENTSDTARATKSGYDYKCSSCGGSLPLDSNYCPNCGMKMDWTYAHDTIGLDGLIVFGGSRYEVIDISVESQLWPLPEELTIKAKALALPEEDET